MTEFGIIKEITQIPANLVSEDDNNAFYLKLGSSIGENISPGNFSPAEAINFFDCIQYPYFSIFATSMHDR